MRERSMLLVLLLAFSGLVSAEPLGANVLEVGPDNGILQLEIDREFVETGDLFVVAESDSRENPEQQPSVIGIERIEHDLAYGKLLSGQMPSVGDAAKRFHGIRAIVTDRSGAQRSVMPELKERFPGLIWQESMTKASATGEESLLRFQVVGGGQIVATYNGTWVVGVFQDGAGSEQMTAGPETSVTAPFAKLPMAADSLTAFSDESGYYIAAESEGRHWFFRVDSGGSVQTLTSIEVPRREKVIRMDWFTSERGNYLVVNQWDGSRFSTSLIQLRGTSAEVVGFVPLLLAVHDLNMDGRREALLGQSFYATQGFGAQVYRISITAGDIEKTADKLLSSYTPLFRVVGAVMLAEEGPTNVLVVSDDKASLYSAGDSEPLVDYKVAEGVAGTEIAYEVNPDLVFSPEKTLFLPNIRVRSSMGNLAVGITSRSRADESALGKYSTRIDWLMIESGRPPKARSEYFLTAGRLSPVSGNSGLFYLSSEGHPDSSESATLIYRKHENNARQ